MLLQKLQQFMYGRYGSDKMNLVLLVLCLIFSFMGTAFFPFSILSTALLIYTLFRMLSKNTLARQKEYAVFMKFWGPIENWFRTLGKKFRDRQTMKYFKCPNCKQQLRAPRGRGSIQVTCQKCHHVFITKT